MKWQNLGCQECNQDDPFGMSAASDPVGGGLVASLWHPGWKHHWIDLRNPNLSEKRLELLKEKHPHSYPS
jgi:hypothetical protein